MSLYLKFYLGSTKTKKTKQKENLPFSKPYGVSSLSNSKVTAVMNRVLSNAGLRSPSSCILYVSVEQLAGNAPFPPIIPVWGYFLITCN